MFTYTDRNERTHTVDLNVKAVLDARREEPPVVWYANNDTRAGIGECMRTRFGVAANPSRLGDIRNSNEWRGAVEAYARQNALDLDALLADSIPRRNRRRTATPAPSTAVGALNRATANRAEIPVDSGRTNLNPAVAGSRTARQEARERMEAQANPPPATTPSPSQKRTDMPERKFGVELEVVSKIDRKPLKRIFQQNGIAVYRGGWERPIDGAWKLGTDISIKLNRSDTRAGYGETMEIVSPPLSGQAGLAELERVLEIIAPYTRTNNSCGLHCHIDMNGLSLKELKRISAAWLTQEWVVNTLIPETRRYKNHTYCHDNGFSPHIAKQNWHAAQHQSIGRIHRLRNILAVKQEMGRDDDRGQSKYRKLNLLSKHGTLEFRHGEGSVDYAEVSNYAKFALGFVEHHKDAPLVSPQPTQPTLWRATAELLANVSEAVGDEQLPYFYSAKQATLKPTPIG